MRFEDALYYLMDGGRVRRACWAVIVDYTRTTPPRKTERVWRIWREEDGNVVGGWGGSVGGAAIGDPVRDGSVYLATDEDRFATDWEILPL